MKSVAVGFGLCAILLVVGCGAEEATPAPTVTETVEVEVPVTPTECLDALEKANDVLAVSGEVITMFQGAVQEAAAQDVNALEIRLRNKDRLDIELEEEVTSYRSYLESCKAQ